MRCCNDIEIESIGTPHTTVSQEAELDKMRRRCNDVEIELIRTPHTTVCQQLEQVRIVTGHQTKQMDDAIQSKIV
jgi:hypothetical protein